MTLIMIAILCLVVAVVEGSYYPECEPKYNYPCTRDKQYKFPTYSSAAYISSLATPVRLPELKIDVYKRAVLLAKNNGVFIPLTPQYNDRAATVTGGPVFEDKYIFALVGFSSNGYPNNTRTGGTQDGEGFPLIFTLYFYNKRYGSFNNSLNYRDGLFIINFPVIVEGNEDNPYFTPFQKLLRKVRKPYSSAFIYAGEAFYWLLQTLTIGYPYYAYPGSYRTSSEEGYRFCSNEIRLSFNIQPWISYRQFDAFQEVQNKFGQPQVRALPLYPFGPRPFVETSSPVCVTYK